MLLRHVRYLKAVADLGSFTRAAQALYVSQPALSQQIKELEERLGAQLLHRTSRKVQPTDAGRIYLQHVERALEALDAGRRGLLDVADLSSGSLRLGMTPSFAAYFIGPMVQRYRQRYPGIILNIRSMAQEEIEAALDDDALDLGMAFSDVKSDGITRTPLYFERLALIVGDAHPAARLAVIDAAQLEKTALALLGPTYATRKTIDAHLRKCGIKSHVAMETNSIASLIEIVRLTDLATILPDSVARPGLAAIPLDPAMPPREVAILQHEQGYRSAAARAFVELALSSVMTFEQPDTPRRS